MNIKSLLLPNVGDFKDSVVIEILVSVGDKVNEGDSIIVLESDKATMEIPAELAGEITELLVSVGDKINNGDEIAKIKTTEKIATGETTTEKTKEPVNSDEKTEKRPLEKSETIEKPTQKVTENSKKITNQQPLGARFHASPMIRQFANALGVNLSLVEGTGFKGRITKEDVENWVKQQLGQISTGSNNNQFAIKPIPEIDFSQFGEIESKKLSRIKKISGQHLSSCWINAPHVTQFDEVSIDDLEAFRQKQNLKLQKGKDKDFKITPLALFIYIVAKTLEDYPDFNVSLSADGESLIVKKYCHIGFAADTPAGLVVPVVRDVNQKGILQIAKDIAELATKARAGTLKPNEMQGSCFTVSSLGGIGGTHFTPIINLPEVAILGIGRSRIKPHWNGEKFEPNLMLPISLSYDHRVIDGANGARFITRVGKYLKDLKTLIL